MTAAGVTDWTEPQAKRRFLGVLGGMGPLASATFMVRLTQLNAQARDQDHVPTLLWSDPRVPDRTDARLHGGPDPLPALLAGVRGLQGAGAQAIVIPCNSAHLWFDELAAHTGAHMLHIVDAALQAIRDAGIRDGCIGLMGTTATLKMGLYQRVLEQAGYVCIQLDDVAQEADSMRAIRLVKANQIDDAYELAARGVRQLQARGAKAVVLGCTELPLAIPHERRAGFSLPLVDSIDALALAALRWYYA